VPGLGNHPNLRILRNTNDLSMDDT